MWRDWKLGASVVRGTNNMLGDKIKELRKTKGRTQKELADYLGCSEAQISHIESGNRKADVDDLRKIAIFFDMPYDYFFVQKNAVVNFCADARANDEISNELVADFKKFALKKIYGNDAKRK